MKHSFSQKEMRNKCLVCKSENIVLIKGDGEKIRGFDIIGYLCYDCEKAYPFNDVKWKEGVQPETIRYVPPKTRKVKLMELLPQLLQEKNMQYRGGLYWLTQIKLAYNSNRIEGSRLTEEQTRYMLETKTLLSSEHEATPIDDIIETQNHFELFNYMLSVADRPLSEEMIKQFHKILKTSTSDSHKDWFAVGDYKKQENIVGDIETSSPQNVERDIKLLLSNYTKKEKIDLDDIINFHYHFEKIHPFQDGNGRVGRIIMFKECLKNNIMPFIIEDIKKAFYYRGLAEYKREPGYLKDTCLDAQDHYSAYYDKLKIRENPIQAFCEKWVQTQEQNSTGPITENADINEEIES